LNPEKGGNVNIYRHLKKADIKKFLLQSNCSYNTFALSWNRLTDDLDEFYEFEISFGKMNEVVIEFKERYGPNDRATWTSDYEVDPEFGDIPSLNELYDWLVARPDRFYGVGFYFEEWYEEEGWDWFLKD
jgi:hypothetical protein